MVDTADAIERAITYVARHQAEDGSIHSFSSPVQTPFKPTITYHTSFVPAIVLGALSGIPAAHTVRTHLATWLLQQKSEQWSFNYWAKQAKERSTLPYPDDLDDTMCALIGLRLHDAALVDEATLGHIVKLLLATETAVGGPYRTWLVPRDSPPEWLDVDLAVNSNIAYFLRLAAEPIPSLTALMEQAITTCSFTSPYYPSAYPILYYIARAYDGPYKQQLADYIIGLSKDGHWQTPLQTALALSALSRLSVSGGRTAAVRHLLHTQAADGSWPAEAYCIDPSKHNTPHYHGAAALTTALVAEALHCSARRKPQKTHRTPPAATNRLYTNIITVAKQEVTALDTPLQTEAYRLLERLRLFNNHREIVLLPYLFAASLQPRRRLPLKLYHHLGLANLYGWMAYTVFDDFLDNEGNPNQLPAATTALRYSLAHFRQALPVHDAFQAAVQATFTIIDTANTWELAQTRATVDRGRLHIRRLPAYGHRERLAERSIGHALAPLGVLAALGISPLSPQAKAITTAFAHYLIARQLSDDMHDWQTDVSAGQISAVVVQILNDLNIHTGNRSLHSLIPAMQRQFWHHTIVTLCGYIHEHTRIARELAAESGILAPRNIVVTLCDDLDAVAHRTLSEQSSAQKFLAAYRSRHSP